MGTTLREIIYDIGGGIKGGKKFKGVQTGGPSGGIITAESLDEPITYESLSALGSMMGSGGMIIMDEDDCVVDIAKFYMAFCVDESCGKCAPCRIGTSQMHDILEKITKGNGTEDDLAKLEKIGKAMTKASLCMLGRIGRQSHALHHQAFPGGVPRAHPRPQVPRGQVQGPRGLLDRPGQVHRLPPLRPQVPRALHRGRAEAGPRHRPVANASSAASASRHASSAPSSRTKETSEMVNAKINGIPVQVAEGTTILDAARKVEVKIPTLCVNDDLEPWAACGICVVKNGKSPKLIRACCTPIDEGMDIVTNDAELVQTTQDGNRAHPIHPSRRLPGLPAQPGMRAPAPGRRVRHPRAALPQEDQEHSDR